MVMGDAVLKLRLSSEFGAGYNSALCIVKSLLILSLKGRDEEESF